MIAKQILKICKNLHVKPCITYNATRTISTTTKRPTSEGTEVEIKVPWGKIAGKYWGSKDVQPILAIHGWQDNASSFDNLGPLLQKNVPILAIDLPGHGLSSWLPPGMIYNEIVYVLLIQRLKRFFNWKDVKLMGHSLGAHICFWHTALFPQETEYVIALDALKTPSVNVQKFNKLFAKAIDNFFKIENANKVPPEYTEEELINRWMEGGLSIEESVCKALLSRSARKMTNGKYIWNRDPRVRILPIQTAFTHDHMQQNARLITCPYIMIKATGSIFFEDEQNVHDIVNLMKKNNPHMYYETIPGLHHVHMTDAERVSNILIPFLEKYNKQSARWEDVTTNFSSS